MESSRAAAKAEISDLKKRLASQSVDVERVRVSVGGFLLDSLREY
jgi:hypothetical protein